MMPKDDSQNFTRSNIAPYVTNLCISYAHLRVSKGDIEEAKSHWNAKNLKGVVRFVARTYHVPTNNLKMAFGVKKYGDSFAGVFTPTHFLDPWKLIFKLTQEETLGGTFEKFIYAVAHEMSHVRLITDGHDLKESEVATDILVLVIGFESQYIDVQNKLTAFERLGYIDTSLINAVIKEVCKSRQVIYLPAK